MDSELIARKDHRSGRVQTLIEHASRVAQAMGRACAAIGFKCTSILIGFTHDLGKGSTPCQIHLLTEGDRSKPPHAVLGARFVLEELCGITCLTAGFGGILANDADPRILAAVIIGYAISNHHTGMSDLITPQGVDELAARVFREDLQHDYEEARARFMRIVSIDECRKLFEEAVGEFASFQANLEAVIARHRKNISEQRVQELRNSHYSMLFRELTSALIDADRTDAYLWSIEDTGSSPSIGKTPAIDWDACNKAVEEYSSKCHDACVKQNPAIAEARESIARCCIAFAAAQLKPGIFKLTADTGSGKTTAALRMLTLYAKQTRAVQRIVYVAPYKTVLLQNADEWQKALGDTIEVLEHHSDAIQEDFPQIHHCTREGMPDSFEKTDDASTRELLVERWSNPFIATTLVQFLNTLFSNKPTRVRRLQALTGSVIVLDEVQSIPLRFVHLVNAALNFLASCCGCTIVCMSATQPAFELTEIPLNLNEPAEIVPSSLGFASCFKRVAVVNETRPRLTVKSLARFAEERCAEEGSTLIVMNTKRSALELARMLAERDFAEVFLVTGYQCSAHREKRLSDIKRALDEARRGLRPPFICVSTSLIEAGVDISFSCGIRAVTGIDSVVQLTGRINRNGETPLANLYLISHEGDERVPPDIKETRQVALRVLHERKADPSSAVALNAYYRYLYARNNHELDYPLKRNAAPGLEDATLFELFTTNRFDLMESRPRRHIACQALRTVGRLMKPIDNDAASVIVPYGPEGTRIIDRIVSASSREGTSITDLFSLIRNAQRYTVSLFERDMHALQNHIESIENLGIYYLKPECYRDEEGVVFPKQESPCPCDDHSTHSLDQ